MTNEEAIEYIHDMRCDIRDNSNYSITDKENTALEMAIAALKAEPCEDAVSREAALKALAELPHEYKTKEQRARTGGIAACQVIVRELPPVAPKPKTGHWVGIDEEPNEVWECDRCGFVVDAEGCIDPVEYRDMYKYCPNCGAKMEGE